jgi:uncharacterized membrane protein YoaK (UPF0700 family)
MSLVKLNQKNNEVIQMITEDRNALILAMNLAGLAGFIDALGFLKLNGFFISFMSGNSTRFAVAISEHGFTHFAIIPLALITLFIIGVMVGALISHHFPTKRIVAVLSFVICLLVMAALFSGLNFMTATVVCMVVAMGAENNIFVKDGQVSIGVTYMTGTLVKFGQKFADALLGKPIKDSLPFLCLWMALIAGAILGSFCYVAIGLASLWVAVVFAIATLITMKL